MKLPSFVQKHKIASAIGLVIALVLIVKCCKPSTRTSEDIAGTEVVYINIDEETTAVAHNLIAQFKSALTPDNDFLKGVRITLTDEYSNLPEENSFYYYLSFWTFSEEENAISFYSDSLLDRHIVIQRDAHGFSEKFANYVANGEFSEMPALKHSIIHEIGHQFDNYFGHDHNAPFALQWDSLMYAKELDPENDPYTFDFNDKEARIAEDCFAQNELSDKLEYKQAILKDLNYISTIYKADSAQMVSNFNYYTQGIDLNHPVKMKDVEKADNARAESYAQLFAYANGQDDSERSVFINHFKNAFEVVKKDMIKYVGKKIVK